MRIAIQLILGALTFLPLASSAGTIYLCKAYSGGLFWASNACGHHNALIERMVSVPDNLPWEQKVALGEQAWAQARALTAPQHRQQAQTYAPPPQQRQGPSKAQQCAALSQRAEHLDARARQLQTAQMQDQIAAEKRDVWAQQSRLRC